MPILIRRGNDTLILPIHSNQNDAPIQREDRQTGFTLLELMITLVIISILAAMAMPLSKNLTKRAKEIELKQNLQVLRAAIDDFHRDWNRDGDNLLGEMCKRNKLTCKEVTSTTGYPKKLDILLNVELSGEVEKSTRHYLRKIPSDPMTQKGEWGFRCYTDAPDAETWCQDDVYDIYTTSNETALDGTKYHDW